FLFPEHPPRLVYILLGDTPMPQSILTSDRRKAHSTKIALAPSRLCVKRFLSHPSRDCPASSRDKNPHFFLRGFVAQWLRGFAKLTHASRCSSLFNPHTVPAC